jgi:hypothetical protein
VSAPDVTGAPFGLGADPGDRLAGCIQDVAMVARAIEDEDHQAAAALERIVYRLEKIGDELQKKKAG